MSSLTKRKKLVLVGTVLGVLAIAGTAFAYFTTKGSGTGNAAIGDSSALVIHQDTVTYSNADSDNILLPGTSATMTFTVDNLSSGNQQLGEISVASVKSDKDGCDSATHPDWFSSTVDKVNTDYKPGKGQAVDGDVTVTFVNAPVAQDVCKGAKLTFDFAA